MHRPPGNIKVIVAAGVPVADAIKAALPCTSAEFAERYGLNPAHVSSCIHGRQKLERVRTALAEILDVDAAWLDEQLDSAQGAKAA